MPRQSELIVIDDGSTDSTLKALSEISDPRLKVVVNNFSIGIAKSLNKGMSISTGKLISRMDADDLTFPWRFALQVCQFEKDAELDFLFTTAIAFGPKIFPFPFLPQLPMGMTDREFRSELLTWNPAVHPTMMARRLALEKLGGYRDLPAEDLDLWLRASVAGCRFKRLATPTLALRLHQSQTSRQPSWRNGVENQKEISLLRGELSRSSPVDNDRPWWKRSLIAMEKSGLPPILAPWKRR